MKTKLFKIVRNSVIHDFVIWFIVEIGRFINFLGYSQHSTEKLHYTINWYLPDTFVVFVYLLFAELNYAFVFKRFKWYIFLLSSLLANIASFSLLFLIVNKVSLGFYFDVRPVAMMTAYGFIYSWLREYFYQRTQKKEIQLQQSKNELDALKAQLNPHFLFNSLNYLYGTALNEQAPNTADGIDKLSAMMRYTITGINENFVPLDNELAFIKNYLDLQQARLPQKDNISINIKIDSAPSSLQIAPLIILPFIENAFQYGISIDEPCFVVIEISLTSVLKLTISNSILPGTTRKKGNNTGIKNTIKRLQLLYPGRYQLQQSNTETGYHIHLEMQLNP
jgi:sensor histidine kinase YesM